MARIECVGLCKSFAERGSRYRMEGLDLEIGDGEILVVLGPSGCGKSTLLRLIAGLMEPDGGRVLYDGVDVSAVPAGERGIGMVFQDYALYPNINSRGNVLSFFLFRKPSPELDADAARKYARTARLLGVELERLMERMPRGLSGGEKQRVAIGRCITRNPKLFLLDEPFSNLDQMLREKYRGQLRTLLKEFGITTVYVTHDQVEALILADRIALMKVGGIEQVGSAREIHDAPRSIFAAEFINFEPEAPPINLVPGRELSRGLAGKTVGVRPDQVDVDVEGGAAGGLADGSARVTADWGGPPSPAPAVDVSALCELHLLGEVLDLRPLPLRERTTVCVRAAGTDVYASLRDASGLAPGARVRLSFPRYHLFEDANGLRIASFGYS